MTEVLERMAKDFRHFRHDRPDIGFGLPNRKCDFSGIADMSSAFATTAMPSSLAGFPQFALFFARTSEPSSVANFAGFFELSQFLQFPLSSSPSAARHDAKRRQARRQSAGARVLRQSLARSTQPSVAASKKDRPSSRDYGNGQPGYQ
jgi:hypothetical protein